MSQQNLKLLNLKIRNLKGCRAFDLDTGGGNFSIYGANRTGKTTLMDAYQWLLFGKDSLDQSDFEVKTIIDGEAAHGLEHSVEAIFDGLTLKKVLTEKWTKRRGSPTREFTGHQIDHWIDGVPVKKGEFDERVNSIADRQNFMLLSNPRYFNEAMHWQKRRETLLAVCGDVSEDQVISSVPELSTLPGILNGRSLSDHRKVIAARRTEINRELEKIPTRIDECNRAIDKDLVGYTGEKIAGHNAELIARVQSLNDEVHRIENGGEIAEQTRRLREVEARIIDFSNQAKSAHNDAIIGKRKLIADLQTEVDFKNRSICQLDEQMSTTRANVNQLKQDNAALRTQWHIVNSEAFAGSMCPTCGQTLPEDQLRTAIERHNSVKAARLHEISEKGKMNCFEIDQIMKKISDIEELKKCLQDEAARLNKQIRTLRNECDDSSLLMAPEITALQQEKDEILKAIESLSTNNPDTTPLKDQIVELNEKVLKNLQTIARIEQTREALDRIKALKAEERSLAAEYEKIEQENYLTDCFIRAKVSLLEDKINNRFKLAQFRLFNQQINGGLEECCEMTVDGVPYNSLNNASRINGGIDVCNALSRHYGISLPIWVDNAEAVDDLMESTSQQIRLVVSRNDSELRVEPEEVKI